MWNRLRRQNRRIFLIDDDAGFCKIMASFAKSRGIQLDCFSSLQDVGASGGLSGYMAAIVDFDLGQMNGVDIAEYLSAFMGGLPTVLISGRDRKRDTGRTWPICIESFIHKDQGPDAILDAATNIRKEKTPRPTRLRVKSVAVS